MKFFITILVFIAVFATYYFTINTGSSNNNGIQTETLINNIVKKPFLDENKVIVFSSTFDSINDFDGYYITPLNYDNRVTQELSSENTRSGGTAQKAWIYSKGKIVEGENTNHRAYPTIQLYKKDLNTYDKYYIEFDVWVDFDIKKEEGQNWLSLATLSSYADDHWLRTLLVNVDSDNKIHLMHLPNQGENKQDIYENKDMTLPMKQWVKIGIYVDYTNNNEYNSPYSYVYQDDSLVSAGRFISRIDPMLLDENQWPSCLDTWDKKSIKEAEKKCNLNYVGGLAQAHFGLYAPPLFSTGTLFNDNLVIYGIQ